MKKLSIGYEFAGLRLKAYIEKNDKEREALMKQGGGEPSQLQNRAVRID